MADLSQFLNSGGKRYRLASTHKLTTNDAGQTNSVSPASDEFAVVKPSLRADTDYAVITVGGRDLTPEPSTWAEPMPMGLGEAVTVTSTSTSSTFVVVYIFEEDA